MIELARAFERAKIDYMVIGGMAVGVWGSGRSTFDVDITVAIDPSEAQRVRNALGQQIARLPEDLDAYLASGVMPFVHRSGTRVDLMLSLHPYAERAIRRAATVKVQGTPIQFCTAEDLIAHKIISDRDRDRTDVEDIIRRQRDNLDRAYLDPLVHELALVMERPEIESRYLSFFS